LTTARAAGNVQPVPEAAGAVQMVRAWALVLTVCLVAGCGQRGSITVDPVARQFGTTEPIFVGTQRAFDPELGTFGATRSKLISYARLDISIPPERQPGEITWPRKGATPDPQTEFLTERQIVFPDAASFRSDLRQEMRTQKPISNQALIFVHGFNNTFAEGTYRIAQLSYDLDLPRVTVHYSWPSAGSALGYVHDRDSALYARDGLEKLFREVVAAGAQEVIVVGHSMGCLLLMETLRQMDIRDSRYLNSHLKGVVMLSPDIDVDVFISLAATFETLPEPFIIFSSERDKALRLSALITGEPSRLGNLTDLNRIADLPVRVVDVAAFSTGTGHFAVGDSPELIALLGRIGSVQAAFDSDNAGRVGILPGLVLTARNATAIVVKPLEVINDEISN
jgi:esterase/lipase superfamily enzyme